MVATTTNPPRKVNTECLRRLEEGQSGGKRVGRREKLQASALHTHTHTSVSSTALLDSTIDLTDDDPLPPPLSLVATLRTPISSTEGGGVCDDKAGLCIDEIRAMRLKRFA